MSLFVSVVEMSEPMPAVTLKVAGVRLPSTNTDTRCVPGSGPLSWMVIQNS